MKNQQNQNQTKRALDDSNNVDPSANDLQSAATKRSKGEPKENLRQGKSKQQILQEKEKPKYIPISKKQKPSSSEPSSDEEKGEDKDDDDSSDNDDESQRERNEDYKNETTTFSPLRLPLLLHLIIMDIRHRQKLLLT